MRSVLIVSGSYPPMPCGVGDYSARLAQSLVETGEIRVGFLTDLEILEKDSRIEFIQGPDWRLRSGMNVLMAIWQWKPDLVHIQYPTKGYGGSLLPWFLPLLLRVFGVPTVQTWHEFLPMFGHAHSFMLCVACKTAVVVRPNFKENLSWWYQWLTRNVRLVFVGGATSLPRCDLSGSERAQLRSVLAAGSKRVVTFFGFATENKGVEHLFKVADPASDRLVLLCDLQDSDEYQRRILVACESAAWQGKVTITGFLPAVRASEILAVSDAVVLPFQGGGGDWNSSVTAVRKQGTLVITTSVSREGYDQDHNTFYCKPGDLRAMAQALTTFGGRKSNAPLGSTDSWSGIAEAHVRIYDQVLRKKSGDRA